MQKLHTKSHSLKHLPALALNNCLLFALCAVLLICLPTNLTSGGSTQDPASAIKQPASDINQMLQEIVKPRDQILMDGADWVNEDVPEGAEIEGIEYTTDGTHLVIRTQSQALLLNAGDGSLQGVFAHDIGPWADAYPNTLNRNTGDVGFNSTASLAAFGVTSGDNSRTTKTVLNIWEVKNDTIRDSIDLGSIYGFVNIARFLPGDSLLVLNFHNQEASVHTIPSGQHGIYNYKSMSWEYLVEDTACSAIRCSQSGRYVTFDLYRGEYYSQGSSSYNVNEGWGKIYDTHTKQTVNSPLRRFYAHLSPDDKSRLFFTLSHEGGFLSEAFWHKDGAFRFPRIHSAKKNGEILPTGQHYAYISSSTEELNDLVKIVNLGSEAQTIVNCITHTHELISFSVSADGSKIALIDANGTVWQQDFDCVVK